MRINPSLESGRSATYELRADPSEDKRLGAMALSTQEIVEKTVSGVSKLCDRSQFHSGLGRCGLRATMEDRDGAEVITVGCDEGACPGLKIFIADTPAGAAVHYACDVLESRLRWVR